MNEGKHIVNSKLGFLMVETDLSIAMSFANEPLYKVDEAAFILLVFSFFNCKKEKG